MTSVGFDKPLYVLPFDHRGSFQKKMFGWEGALNLLQTAEIAAAKRVIYDAFTAAIHAGVPKEKAGILVDEQFGAAILRGARAAGYTTACPAEKSGQDEFDFEYGEDFEKHIEAFHPTFCKVLVRYNPEGDPELNRRQSARLKRLSDYLHSEKSRSRFMFELLVPGREGPARRASRRQESLRSLAASAPVPDQPGCRNCHGHDGHGSRREIDRSVGGDDRKPAPQRGRNGRV